MLAPAVQHLIGYAPPACPCRGSSAGQSASFSKKGDTHNLEVVGSKPTPGTHSNTLRTAAVPPLVLRRDLLPVELGVAHPQELALQRRRVQL